MNLSIVIVSYNSAHLIEKLILSIPKDFEIIIIENSLDINLKDKLEKIYKNVQIIIPEKNLGVGKATNIGLKKSKNNFVFCLSPDVEVSKECFMQMLNIVHRFEDFTMLAPTYFDEKINKNYKFNKNHSNKKIKTIDKFNLIEVDEIDTAAVIINKSKIDNIEIYDENFFLYFENIDLCLRLIEENKKLYVVDNLKFIHYGTKSSNPEMVLDIKICRNWHYCWSKFYFLRKHHGYLYGIRKTLPNLIRALKSCFINFLKNDIESFKLHKAELSGLINSYFLRKSSYRPLQDK